MAITNNNVGNVKFLRNGSLYGTHDAAYSALTDFQLTTEQDGTIILARYGSGDNVKTLAGLVYADATYKTITIVDVEGGSADVEKLREEINAKLGTDFISSGNTVEANLTALSGDTFVPGTSSSADTSVEGAKAYAYDLLGTLDYTDTAADGEYVSQVTQTDGIISVTRVALPSSADTAVAKKVVIAVSEDKGQIEVTRGEISSSAETLVLTDNADGGVNFEVNIDNNTIIQDADTKKLKVADAALVQYEGDTKTIAISPVEDGVRTVSTLLTLSSVTPSSTSVREEYALKNASGETIGSTIKIYKDSSLYSAYLGHVDDTITSATDPTVVPGTGDTALCFIYLKTDGTYELVAVNVEEFIEENEFASGVTWDNIAKKVKGVVDPTSEKDSQGTPVDFLTVGADGFKVSGIKDEIGRELNAIVEDLDATVTGETANQHVSISIEELDGKLVQSGLTITESNIANADDLANLSAKTITNIDSANSSITVTPADADDGTQKIDLATDASKIQMSGFTSVGVLSGITSSSSITEAFGEVDTVVTGIRSDVNIVSGDVDTIKSQYVSGVSVNGNAVTVANHVAPISISAATSATTAETSNAIVVDTDANGNITLGLNYIDCGTY